MKTNISAIKSLGITAVFCAAVLVGCADYVGVGVGYGDAYYVPDYRPLYAAYYYDGVPYWGSNFAYVKKKIVVKDVNRHVNVNRNIYYGGHHLRGNWAGVRGGGFRRGGFRRAHG